MRHPLCAFLAYSSQHFTKYFSEKLLHNEVNSLKKNYVDHGGNHKVSFIESVTHTMKTNTYASIQGVVFFNLCNAII